MVRAGRVRGFPDRPDRSEQKGKYMPKYTADSDMEGAYGAETPVTPPEDSSSETEQNSVDKEEQMSDTALVSNKILSPEGEPLKEGDEIVVRIVKNYGDESEIEYAPKEKGSSEESGEPMSQEANELSALSEEGSE